MVVGGIGQLHDDGQLALCGPDPCPDVGMPVKMVRSGGVIAGNLRAFSEICQIKVEAVAVGGGDLGDHGIQHPRCTGDIIQPGQSGATDLGGRCAADKARVFHLVRLHQSDQAGAISGG